MSVAGESDPQRWLWVTRPDYYLDEDGRDRRDLEPDVGFAPGGWWTCAPATRAGDLALLYRSRERKDVSHLLVARSDAAPLDLADSPFHGKPVCEYEVITKFATPVPFGTIRADPLLGQWGETRRRFVRSAVPVPDEHWQRLIELAGEDRAGLELQAVDGLRRIRLEKQIQQWLHTYPGELAAHGLRNLTEGRKEFYFPNGGRADLVYTQGRGPARRFVVIELKRGQIGPAAVEQVLRYRTLLDAQRPAFRKTLAVLVGSELHRDATRLLTKAGLQFISLSELNMTRAGVPTT